jgi:hypothetical protein
VILSFLRPYAKRKLACAQSKGFCESHIIGLLPVFRSQQQSLHNWRFSETAIAVNIGAWPHHSVLPCPLLFAPPFDRFVPMTVNDLRQVALFESLDDDAAN